jgi:hypothetical protein
MERIAVFIQTHADADRGDLWYRGNSLGGESMSTNISDVGTAPTVVLTSAR